jgi:hypothetical protein
VIQITRVTKLKSYKTHNQKISSINRKIRGIIAKSDRKIYKEIDAASVKIREKYYPKVKEDTKGLKEELKKTYDGLWSDLFSLIEKDYVEVLPADYSREAYQLAISTKGYLLLLDHSEDDLKKLEKEMGIGCHGH